MMNLAALTAGVDRPLQTPEETFHLYGYLMTFIEGATLAHATGDKEAKRAEVARALVAFDEKFIRPSVQRRRTALEQLEAGELDEEDLPRDVLMVLLRNTDGLHLPHDVLVREIAFFLLAGAHTSATAFTRTLHNVFTWLADHPQDREALRRDRIFVQRCVHETIRLAPSSPVAMRWALEPFTLRTSGREVARGDKVVVDLLTVNRSTTVFGEDADRFDPNRATPDGVSPWGLSFGGGMHVCIGQDLSAGVLPGRDQHEQDHLFGLVPIAVQAMLDRGARPDPDEAPHMDTTTKRPYWGRYPVRFSG